MDTVSDDFGPLGDFDHENRFLANISDQHFETVIHLLRDPLLWRTFQTTDASTERGRHHSIAPLELAEAWCIDLAQVPVPWTTRTTSPQHSFREKIVLHTYSGRRRRGDFQWFFDQCCASSPGILCVVVSLDIVIDEKYGNIGDPEIRAFWYRGMFEGYIVGMLSGPPCCTWSCARFGR